MVEQTTAEYKVPERVLLASILALALRDFVAEVKRIGDIRGARMTEVGRWLLASDRDPLHPKRPLTCRFVCDHLDLSHSELKELLMDDWRSLLKSVDTMQTALERKRVRVVAAEDPDDTLVDEKTAALLLGVRARDMARERREGMATLTVYKAPKGGGVRYLLGEVREAAADAGLK